MCGRYDLIVTPKQIATTFTVEVPWDFEASYNIAPNQPVFAIINTHNEQAQAVWLHWGLIPAWAKDPKISHHLINARAETVAEKPSFRSAFKKRRCLICATGFYEWQHSTSGKQAYRICPIDKQVFAFAGLWEHWQIQGQSIYSCTIITTAAANDLMLPIHARMPVILPQMHYQTWLASTSTEDSLQHLLHTDGYDHFHTYPVSSYVNNPQHNDIHCISPIK